jgi:cardiolipin synthase
VNAFIYNEKVGKQFEHYFREDLTNSREITLEEWEKREWIKKFQESIAHIFSPML